MALGTGLLLGNLVFMTLIQSSVMQSLSQGMEMKDMTVVIRVFGVVRSLMGAVGIGLLLAAGLVGRSKLTN